MSAAKAARAAVMEEPGRIELRSFPVPDPEPGAVVLKMTLSGICGTDKHTFRGETLQYPGTPHERRLEYPLICGHENVGTVAAIGGDASDEAGRPLRVGDRVVPGANVPCGDCWHCRSGHAYYLCERLEDYGNSLNAAREPRLFGGWAEYLYLLPGSKLFRVPDELPDEVAVLTEIMAVTHGFERARRLSQAPAGESVAVLGAGPLGLCHVIKARLLGCGRLVAVDRMRSRAEAAQQFGATLGLVAGDEDEAGLIARVKQHTHGRGPDVVLDCTGVPESFVTALRMVRPGGTVVEAGAFVDGGAVAVNPAAEICAKDVAVIGIGGETAEAYPAAMRLLAANLGRLPLERFVTHRFPLERAREAIELAQTDAALKVVLDPALGAQTGGPSPRSLFG